MTIKELIKQLSHLPENAEVYLPFESCGVDEVKTCEVVLVERFKNRGSSCCGEHEVLASILNAMVSDSEKAWRLIECIKPGVKTSIGVLIAGN